MDMDFLEEDLSKREVVEQVQLLRNLALRWINQNIWVPSKVELGIINFHLRQLAIFNWFDNLTAQT